MVKVDIKDYYVIIVVFIKRCSKTQGISYMTTA